MNTDFMAVDYEVDPRYKFVRVMPSMGERKFAMRKPRMSESLEVEAFVLFAVGSSRIPVEVLHPEESGWVSLPVSENGRTTVRWAGNNAPQEGGEDEWGNFMVKIDPGCALEIIYNSLDEVEQLVTAKKRIIYFQTA